MTHPREDDYRKLVKGFRKSLLEATRSYAISKGLQLHVAKDPTLNERLNQNTWTWQTIFTSLQITYIVGVSKLFDSNSKSSLDKVVSFCERNADLFSREALLARKIRSSASFNDATFASDYLSQCHCPVSDDFKIMRSEVEGFSALQETIRTLRNKVYAHDDLMDYSQVWELFSSMVNTDIEALIAKCHVLIDELDFGLFNNGRRPDFSRIRSFDELADVHSIYEEVLSMSFT